MMIFPLWFNAVGWSWQMLHCFFGSIQSACAFFPFPSFIAGATSLVLQYKFSQSLQYTCAADPLYGWTSLSSPKCAISHFWLYLPNPFTILELEKWFGKLFFSRQWCKKQAAGPSEWPGICFPPLHPLASTRCVRGLPNYLLHAYKMFLESLSIHAVWIQTAWSSSHLAADSSALTHAALSTYQHGSNFSF